MQISFNSEIPVLLEPKVRKTKKGALPEFIPAALEQRLSIGTPASAKLTPDVLREDSETAAFVKNSGSEFAFDLVAFSCTFHPSDKEPFEAAWLGVTLAAVGKKEPHAIALGMKPLHDGDLIEKSNAIKFEAGLTLFGEVGPKIAIESAEKYNKGESFLVGFGLGGPKPYWSFKKTLTRKVEGSYRLVLVVRRAKSAPTVGTILAEGRVRQKALLIPYRTAVKASQSGLKFELS